MPGTVVRPVREPDLGAVLGLVRELGEYERTPPRCLMTRGQLRGALFGPEPSRFAHVAEARGIVVGYGLWSPGHSPGESAETGQAGETAHGIYLHNLYVRPEYRGRGVGRGLLAALAAESRRRGHVLLEWSVPDWNMPAIAFYEALGARPTGGSTMYGLSGAALSALGR